MSLNCAKNFDQFFAGILDYKNFDATNKINGFPPQYSSSSVMVQTGLMLEEFKFVVAEQPNFENCEK